MKTIKWGIIGTGNIANKFATALTCVEGAGLKAVASRDIVKAKEFAQHFDIEKAYGSYEDLAKDPEIDVIYIATPHTQHKDNSLLCISNGKSVLCEKPFTLNYGEAKELVDLSKEKEVFLMEAMWTKFLPITKLVKEWIKDERIGEVKHIKASFGFCTEFDINNRLFNPGLAGGALLDVGIYPITYAIHIMERTPDRISSQAILGKSNVDEQNTILFSYDHEGVMVNVSSAIIAAIGNDAHIIGTKGSIHVPKFWGAQNAKLYDLDGNLVEDITKPFEMNGYEYEIHEVNHCLRGAQLESNINPLRDTLDIMKLMDGLRADWGVIYPDERQGGK